MRLTGLAVHVLLVFRGEAAPLPPRSIKLCAVRSRTEPANPLLPTTHNFFYVHVYLKERTGFMSAASGLARKWRLFFLWSKAAGVSMFRCVITCRRCFRACPICPSNKSAGSRLLPGPPLDKFSKYIARRESPVWGWKDAYSPLRIRILNCNWEP